MTLKHKVSAANGILLALPWAVVLSGNLSTVAQEFQHRNEVVQIYGATSDHEKLITATENQTVWIWEFKTGKLINRMNRVLHAMLSADGSTLTLASQLRNGAIKLKFLNTLRDLRKDAPEREVLLPGYTKSIAISPDGVWLAYCYGRVVHLVNRDQPNRDRKLTLQVGKGENSGFQLLEFGPNASTLVVGTLLAGKRMYRFLDCNDGSVIAEGKGESSLIEIHAQDQCLVSAGASQIVALDMKTGDESFAVWKWFQDRELNGGAYLGNGRIIQVTNAVGASNPLLVRGGSTVNNSGILIITRTATYFPPKPSKPGLLAFGDFKSGLEKTVVFPSGIGPLTVSPGKDRIAFETGEGVQVWTTNPPALEFEIESASIPVFTDNQTLLHNAGKRKVVTRINLNTIK